MKFLLWVVTRATTFHVLSILTGTFLQQQMQCISGPVPGLNARDKRGRKTPALDASSDRTPGPVNQQLQHGACAQVGPSRCYGAPAPS